MKKIQLITLTFLMIFEMRAQAPQGINYQAAVRNASGLPLASAAVTMRFGIYSGAGATTKVYEETQSLNTNTAGLVNCVIGKGTVVIGTFNTINWGSDIFSIKTEANTGGGFVDMGTQQLMSVPYALYAGNAGNAATATSATTAATASTLSGTITPSQITQAGASSGNGLVWNGTQWGPAALITGVSAGTGLTGGGTSGNITLDAKNTTAMWNASQIQGIGITPGANAGQFLKYNGTNWVASDPFISAAGSGVTVTSGTINTPWTISGNNIFKNNSGNVGIGAASPSELLHTQSGSINAYNLAEVTSATLDAGFSAKSTGGASDYMQMVKHGSSAGGTTAGGIPLANLSRLTAGAGAGPMLIHVISASPMIFATSNVERMRIGANGEVGIGINVPSTMTKLHVVGTGAYGVAPYYMASIVGDDTFSNHASSSGIYGKGGWRGIFGHNKGTAAGSQAIGVHGLLEGSKYVSYGYGVLGENQGTGGNANYGVYGTASGAGTYEYGVYGLASAGSKSAIGVAGISNSTTASTFRIGVYGAGINAGIFGTSTGGSAYSYLTTLSSLTPAIVGMVRSVSSGRPIGVMAFSGNPSTSGASATISICDSNSYNYGIEAYARYGTGSNYAIYGNASGTSPYAGYFSGAIYATSANSSIKAFKIDHPQDPENKYLYHSSVESPDMMNVYNGNITTDDNGNATITLPTYFSVLNKDFKYQLTCMGQFAQAIVMEEIKDNQFTIKTDKPNVKVSWMVTGVRQDAAANFARIQVEVEKPASEKGFYLMPEAYGFGPEKNAAWYNSSQNKNHPGLKEVHPTTQPAPVVNPANNVIRN